MGRLQRWVVGGVLAAGTLVGGAGLAQEDVSGRGEPAGFELEPESTATEPGRRVETQTVKVETDRQKKTRGYVLLGGGLDIYTGGLGNNLRNAPALGVTAGVTRKNLGLEASYSGGVVEGQAGEFGAGPGTDAVRSSGQLALTAGLMNTRVQPFALAGVGVDFYNVREVNQVQGWRDDSAFNIPTGVGVRFNATKAINVDARMTYNFLQGEEFVPGGATGNRIQGLLSAGGRF
ncbi:MAG: hypothetical protein RL653_2596 [Pseudomonadota bacterium]|jgi:hypothetical protein